MFYSQVWLCDQVWPSEWSYTFLLPHSPPAGWNVDVTAECHKSFWPRRQKPCFLVGVGQQTLGPWGFLWLHHQPAYAESCLKGEESTACCFGP